LKTLLDQIINIISDAKQINRANFLS